MMPDPIGQAGPTLSDRVLRMEVERIALGDAVRELSGAVTVLSNRVNGRPSWAVSALLTSSFALNAALLTALAGALHH